MKRRQFKVAAAGCGLATVLIFFGGVAIVATLLFRLFWRVFDAL